MVAQWLAYLPTSPVVMYSNLHWAGDFRKIYLDFQIESVENGHQKMFWEVKSAEIYSHHLLVYTNMIVKLAPYIHQVLTGL